jgi:uncharacterized membrane protein
VPPGELHAVLWNGYRISNLGTLGGSSSQALALSGALIVGKSEYQPNSYRAHAFLYDDNGPGYPVDLNDLIPTDSQWELLSANGINAAGQIIVSAALNGNVGHALLLTPVASHGARTRMSTIETPRLPWRRAHMLAYAPISPSQTAAYARHTVGKVALTVNKRAVIRARRSKLQHNDAY